MTNRQIQRFCEKIDSMSGLELLNLRQILNDKIDEVSALDENFMLHDYVDSYFYYVHYEDGSSHLHVKGKDAYDTFMRSETAVKIVRKTKNLFPTFEEIMRKESNGKRKEKGLRCELH